MLSSCFAASPVPQKKARRARQSVVGVPGSPVLGSCISDYVFVFFPHWVSTAGEGDVQLGGRRGENGEGVRESAQGATT